jgi:two-component system, chemotaxis family, protein-glutamate methylesterase/glutaminase
MTIKNVKTIKVLIVDDSVLFRNYLRSIIDSDPELEVIDIAIDGNEAVEKARNLAPDVITMDVNMPVMDGIATVRQIMKINPIPILMLSAVTSVGAKTTFDALEAGAVDFLPKDKNFTITGMVDDSCDIIKKIKTVARSKIKTYELLPTKYEAVLIGSSTGGPIALQTIMRGLPSSFPVPIVIIQHMPENFTKPFSERINSICNLHVQEAADGDILKVGNVYVAPGGKQLTFKKQLNGLVKIEIHESDPNLYYRPCIDLSFNSASTAFKEKILTLIFFP